MYSNLNGIDGDDPCYYAYGSHRICSLLTGVIHFLIAIDFTRS